MYKAIAFFLIVFIGVSVLSNVLIGFIFALLTTGYLFGERDGL